MSDPIKVTVTTARSARWTAVSDPIKVTVTDPYTGKLLGETLVENDYVVICAGNRYVQNVQVHANGTAVVTVKRTGEAAS